MIATKETIHEVIIRLAMGWGKHPYEINNGECEDFAYAVQEVIPEVKVYWGDELIDNFDFFTKAHEPEYHAFMYYNGKYYDSEEPFGVDNPAHLPCFRRKLQNSLPKESYSAPREKNQFTPEPAFNFVVRSWEV